jgi:hypothetical protein
LAIKLRPEVDVCNSGIDVVAIARAKDVTFGIAQHGPTLKIPSLLPMHSTITAGVGIERSHEMVELAEGRSADIDANIGAAPGVDSVFRAEYIYDMI